MAQPDIRKEKVQFAAGKSTATVTGTLVGDQTVDYLFAATGGQAVEVTLKPSSTSNYFNVMPPGTDEAIFIGSTSGNLFKGTVPKTGEYTARVYLMRNAARRGAKSNYTMTFRLVGAGGTAATPASGSWPAKFDATGSVKCSAGEAKLDKMCEFRVVRKAGGADIYIAKPAAAASHRVLYFSNKIFTTNDKGKLAWQRKEDNWWVSVNGSEFYFIPDALIYGG